LIIVSLVKCNSEDGKPANDNSSNSTDCRVFNGSCSFNNATFTLSCGNSDYKYSSVSDFIDEVKTNGKILSTRKIVTYSDNTQYIIIYDFDGEKRLVYEEGKDESYFYMVSYNTWDIFGRPTTGDFSNSNCNNMNVSISYDDIKRTKKIERTGGTGDKCSEEIYIYFYDENGILIKETNISKPLATYTYTFEYTVKSLSKVCK
jgi:hypothetical protein